jgi:polysaccharide pyruvyl transferase WcaK-like protein
MEGQRVGMGIGLLDPSVGTRNAGDLIIRESVISVLRELGVQNSGMVVLPTQTRLSREQRRTASSCQKFIVGGTNLLTSHILGYHQWKLRPADLGIFRQNVTLLGVGWWQYQRPPDLITRTALRRVLRPNGHAIRDAWSSRQLATARVESANTACPTMWSLPDHPEGSMEPGRAVVVTLTDYNRSIDEDTRLLELLAESYAEVKVWPQGSKDLSYLRRINARFEVLGPGLAVFDKTLEEGSDYVGTRLHAGIRALQKGARTTIVTVDNRAREMAKDTGLPTVERDLSGADETLFGRRMLTLRIPRDAVQAWMDETRVWLEDGRAA